MKLLLTFLLIGLFASVSAVSGDTRPNIVILLADDLGYGELGCQGNDEIPTPHIDSIATNGVRFTSGYVTASFCSASRAGLMSGRYQHRFDYFKNPIGAQNEAPGVGLPLSEKTLATRLQEQGYATALVGKWHLGGSAPYHPQRRGFDEFFGFTHEGHFFVPPPYEGVTTMLRRKALPDGSTAPGRWTSKDGKLILSSHMKSSEPDYDANNPVVRQSQPANEQEYLTDAFTREAVDFIDRHKERPFFLYLAYNAVHSPLQGADKYMQRFESIDDIQRRIFAAMLANLDDSVGSVLEKLRVEDLLDNTLVFFLSDNGGPTRELTSSNLPLRGGKGQVYEGGIRVPFMVQWPSKIKSGRIYEHPVISLDIAATVLDACKAKPQSNADGVNLMPYLENIGSEDRPHETLQWRMSQREAYRFGDWKLVRHSRKNESRKWEMYNLSDDVGETKDLAIERPDKFEQLMSRVDEMR